MHANLRQYMLRPEGGPESSCERISKREKERQVAECTATALEEHWTGEMAWRRNEDHKEDKCSTVHIPEDLKPSSGFMGV